MKAWPVWLVLAACGDPDPAPALSWTSCGFSECTTLDVPVDPGDPAAGTATIALGRIVTTQERRGAVMLVAGGPGSSGVDLLGGVGLGLAGEGYDVYAFDARGVDDSTAVICGTDDDVDAIVELDTSPDTPAERAALDDAAAAWVLACDQSTDAALLAHVDSATAAHDLEAIRVAVGVDTVNLLAFSYGTKLATRYAALHPERVRSMVLDSPDPIDRDLEDALRLQAIGYQDALERFYAWCAGGCDGAATCFHGGETADDVRAAFVAARTQIEVMALNRRADRALLIVLQEAAFLDLSRALTALEGGSPDALLALYPTPATHDDGSYTNFFAARAAIWNADHVTPDGFTAADVDSLMAELVAGDAPEAAAFTLSEAPNWLAGHWDARPAIAPAPFAAPDSPPVLLLAATHDPDAPMSEVTALRDALGPGSTIIVRDGDGHGQLGDPCMLDLARAYLEDPTTPPAATACP